MSTVRKYSRRKIEWGVIQTIKGVLWIHAVPLGRVVGPSERRLGVVANVVGVRHAKVSDRMANRTDAIYSFSDPKPGAHAKPCCQERTVRPITGRYQEAVATASVTSNPCGWN